MLARVLRVFSWGNVMRGIFLRRTRYHMDAEGSLSEQINRDNGFMQGAHDLTWSYASFFTAAQAR